MSVVLFIKPPGAGLRSEVRLIGSGKVYSGFSLVRTLAHGADLTNAARAFMFSLGCIQALKCNANTCPTGITTQQPELEAGLDVPSKAQRIANFHRATVHSAIEIVGALGVSGPAEVRPHHLYRRESGMHTRDFSRLHEDLFGAVAERPGLLLSDPSAVPPQLRAWWDAGRELHQSTRAH